MLKRYVIEQGPSLSLTESEYNQILVAKRRIFEHLAVEELFDILVGNYEEFERELLSITLKDAIYFDANDRWTDAIGTIQLAGRRAANLLTTTHGYCDQVPHSISTLFGKASPELEAVKGYFRHEYESVLGYRVCTELRRHMQHRGTAVHGFRSGGSQVERPNGRRVHVSTFVPQIDVGRLQDDKKFKPGVLQELLVGGIVSPSTGSRVHDLRPFIRQYVSALGRVHLKVRELLAPDAETHDAVITETIDRYSALPGSKSPIGLAAMQLDERGLFGDRFPSFVMREPIERRQQLARRNHLPSHFDTQVVSNEVEQT